MSETAYTNPDGTPMSEAQFDAIVRQLDIAIATYRIQKGETWKQDRYDRSRWES